MGSHNPGKLSIYERSWTRKIRHISLLDILEVWLVELYTPAVFFMCYRAEPFTVQNNNVYKDKWPETLRRWKQKYEGFTNVYSIIPSPLQSWIMKWMHLTSVTNLIKLQNMWGHKHLWNLHNIVYLNGQCHEIFCFRFFHESSSPKPLKRTLRSLFEFCRKFAEILAIQGAPLVSTTSAANCHRYQGHRR